MNSGLHLKLLRLTISAVLLLLFVQVASATVVDLQEQYQDYNGSWHKYNDANLRDYPMFLQSDNSTDRLFTSWNDTIYIPKTLDVTLSERKISPSMTFPKTQLATRMVNYNTTIAYLRLPHSLSRVADYVDAHNIKLGRWNFDTSISIHDGNGTTFDPAFYDFKIVNNEIRLYFIKAEANKLVGNITFQMNSWTIDNATTSGFTSANVTFDGVRWTDSGQVAINLRNDSQLNMTGLVAYWSMDENTGTRVHNVNTESGLVNTTNQGTWNGNTTLNYSTGKIGNAPAFDGVNDYVDMGLLSNDVGNGTDNFSIVVWVKSNNLTSTAAIAGKVRFTSSSWGLYQDSSKFNFVDRSSTSVSATSTNNFNVSTWYYLVGVKNSSGVSLYIDGILNKYTVGVTESMNSASNNFYVGRRVQDNLLNFNGSIDEVRIYNRALSASEIAVLYNTSMRTQGNLTILNQSASAGNVINRTRIVYTGQDSINNISIYARQNGTTTWSLVQNNATSNTWYPVVNPSLDFKIQLNGNGSNTPFFTSLEWDETATSTTTTVNPNWAIGYYLAGGAAIAGALYGAYRRRMRSNQMIVYSIFGGKV